MIVADVVAYACFTEDLKRLNEKLVETNTIKMELQLKLDELQASEVSIQVSSDSPLRTPVKWLDKLSFLMRSWIQKPHNSKFHLIGSLSVLLVHMKCTWFYLMNLFLK